MENSFIKIGSHVVVDKKTIGTIIDCAKRAKYPDDADWAIYLVEYDSFWGKRSGWFSPMDLHVINSALAKS